MTNDEAIKLLSQIMDVLLASNSWLPSTKNPIKESFGMAIDALTAQPETHGVCLDVIDRQAAIRWVKTECNPYGKPTLDFESGKKVIEHLEQMPSAQADSKELSFTHKALDTISRQAAMDALNEYFARIGKLKRRGLTKGEKAISLDTVGTVKTLPSVQPERQTGHWERDGHHIKCSVCGIWMCDTDREGDAIPNSFCPNCGADMKGEQDGVD